MRVFTVLFILLIVVTADFVSAQSFYAIRRERSLIATVGSGTSHYFGEMVNPGEFGKTRFNLLVGAEYFFTNRISARGELTYFRLAGSDAEADDDR
jgi:hypothetical protein